MEANQLQIAAAQQQIVGLQLAVRGTVSVAMLDGLRGLRKPMGCRRGRRPSTVCLKEMVE